MIIKKRKKLLICLILLFLAFWGFQPLQNTTGCAEDLFSRKPSYDDKELIHCISKEYLIPPSSEPYNLVKGYVQNSFVSSEIFYHRIILETFDQKWNGFFVEAGALDGETMSNTLWLEIHRNWTGLLVEPTRNSFQMLKKKHRKAWIANICLSLDSFPTTELMISYTTLKHYSPIVGMRNVALASLSRVADTVYRNSFSSAPTFLWAQCFPLSSILLSLGVKTVDFLSLDTEHGELDILKNFDFSRFDVKMIGVEHTGSNETLVGIMSRYNYRLVAFTEDNYVFIKKKS